MITTLLVDGHVHYHPCFGIARFFDAAVANFRAARREVGHQDAVGCLMFSENSWSHAFQSFMGGLIEREAPGWSVSQTDEDCSVVARSNDGTELVLVAGRQIVTADRLEVLALATAREYPDGLPLGEAIGLAVSTGAIAVLPWGFGKWTGRRGRTVEGVLSSPQAEDVFVGDNGGRPAMGPTPPLFELARTRGVPILPGSDPLPLTAEAGKPGRVGFVLEGRFDPRAPAAAIRTMLSGRSQPRRFGRLEKLGTFVVRQAALRLRRRGGRRS